VSQPTEPPRQAGQDCLAATNLEVHRDDHEIIALSGCRQRTILGMLG